MPILDFNMLNVTPKPISLGSLKETIPSLMFQTLTYNQKKNQIQMLIRIIKV